MLQEILSDLAQKLFYTREDPDTLSYKRVIGTILLASIGIIFYFGSKIEQARKRTKALEDARSYERLREDLYMYDRNQIGEDSRTRARRLLSEIRADLESRTDLGAQIVLLPAPLLGDPESRLIILPHWAIFRLSASESESESDDNSELHEEVIPAHRRAAGG